MLIIDKKDSSYEKLPQELKTLLDTLARTHVSPTPIKVISYAMSGLRFEDVRFPDRPSIARMEIDRNTGRGYNYYRVYSHRIKNDKFGEYSEGYKTRESKDPKKMLKILKEVTQPYEIKEIVAWSLSSARSNVASWKHQISHKLEEITEGVHNSDILEELAWLHQAGVTFRNPAITKLATEGKPIYDEYLRRKTMSDKQVFVLVEESGRVHTYDGETQETKVYLSLPECPENIQTSVTMLRIHGNDTFLPEVGWRRTPNEYWVLCPTQNT